MGGPILSLRGVTKAFGGVVALNGVDLEVSKGEILALVGPNGAGKSVLVNIISGFYQATSGAIQLSGKDVTTQPAHARARSGMARTFQNIRLFRRMSVIENVLVAIKAHAIRPFRSVFQLDSKQDIDLAMDLLELAGLASKANDSAATLAYGEARRLEIARALAGKPQLLLLDEPAAGMNDHETQELSERIAALRTVVSAIVVIEHDMGFLSGLCDRMVVLDYGRLIANGQVAQVLKDSRVVEAYLGVDE